MSLLGLDVGTSGCKAVVFSKEGRVLASAYNEYDFQAKTPGWAELDAVHVWDKIEQTIAKAASAVTDDPIVALSVSSLGEAVVPVSKDRKILGPSILNFDIRGEEYILRLKEAVGSKRLYDINGNILGNNYSLTKLLWIRDNQPELYDSTYKFLLWGSFVPFMLGADPVVDYSLANRTLLFDLERRTWSREMLKITGLDREKLPDTLPSGKVIGTVSQKMAERLGLGKNVAIISGAHDQCANAVGSGAIEEGMAMYGMGTFICIVPVFKDRKDTDIMLRLGLNTEHHALEDKYVSFIYNQGGSLVKWFRDTFASMDKKQAALTGEDIYAKLDSEMPQHPSPVMVLPHFTLTGPPEFIDNSSGVMAGLRLETTRGDILKGIMECTTFYMRECVEEAPKAGINISDFRVVGGGSKSDEWVQICSDILGIPFTRPVITEAGALGAAIIAGVGQGIFQSHKEGVDAMVKPDKIFEPTPRQQKLYDAKFQKYKQLWPLMKEYLSQL
ncbi:MAG TPA: hypothetical protein GXZ32_04295 [Clostridiales bacterium]|nr:hypothetical protein [Clostridiales bacterium]